MRWGCRPKLPTLYPPEGSLEENLSKNSSSWIPPVVSPEFETNEILYTLQTMSNAIELPEISLGDKKAISDVVNHTEYQLLSMDHAQTDPDDCQRIPMSPLSYAFTIAALLYLEIVIREHPYISKVHHRLASKIHIFLEETNPSRY